MSPKKLFLTLFVLACSCLLTEFAWGNGDDRATLRGRVLSDEQATVAGATVILTDQSQKRSVSVVSDAEGAFSLVGIAPGLYTLRVEAPGFEPLTRRDICFEPSSDLYFKVRLESPGGSASPHSGLNDIDTSPLASRTSLPPSQIRTLPSGHSVWSLIENQDLSATTNRIDVGGLWETQPALFSARGSGTWTQNSFSLNGFDVTDPYWGGTPLFIPDLFSLGFVQMSNADHPAEALSSGGHVSLIPEDGTSEFHGGFSGFYLDKNLTTTNITPALQAEGLRESTTFGGLKEFNFHLSGPLAGPRLEFSTSLTSQNVVRNIADFEAEDRSQLFSGLVNIVYRGPLSSLRFFWTGQSVSNPSAGAGRNIPFVSTTRQKILSNILQAIVESNPQKRHSYRLGLSLAITDLTESFQAGAQGPTRLEIFKNIPSGSAVSADADKRHKLTGLFEGQSCFLGVLHADHVLRYGFHASYADSSSAMTVPGNRYLYFLNGLPVEVVDTNSPISHRESEMEASVFAQDDVSFGGSFSLHFGVNAEWTRGRNSVASVSWFAISPRFGLNVPLFPSRTSFLRVSAARYYFNLPLNYLAYGNPGAPGGSVYAWHDLNGDLSFQPGERGTLLRKEGPLYSEIDPGLKRPYTDEYAISIVHDFGAGWIFTLGGFLRETRNLVETVNIGVLPGDYFSTSFYDEGDDRIPGTADDLTFSLSNQNPATLGRDHFLLSNPDAQSRVSRYRGVDLSLVKRYGSFFTFFISLTAMEAIGTTSPGNTEWENDDGVIGLLYDNPNASVNARGRLRFDRAYTGRIGLSVKAPFGTRLGAVVKYYDGQPFARKIIVQGFNQGPFYIMAHPRGVSRTEFNMTVDVRLEKEFRWDKGAVRFIIDGFNIFNHNLATQENEWTGPDYPRRFATEIQSPRVFRVGVNFEF